MSLGFTEIILIALFILIVFGAKRIPELARAFGRASYEFKKAKKRAVRRRAGVDGRSGRDRSRGGPPKTPLRLPAQ